MKNCYNARNAVFWFSVIIQIKSYIYLLDFNTLITLVPLVFGANLWKLKYEHLKIVKFQNRLSRIFSALICFLRQTIVLIVTILTVWLLWYCYVINYSKLKKAKSAFCTFSSIFKNLKYLFIVIEQWNICQFIGCNVLNRNIQSFLL